jgi:hypothetical protein
MKDIEAAFQALADRIVSGLVSLNAEDATILTRFFALWTLRQHYDQNRVRDPTIDGVGGEPFTEETQDRLEALGGASVISGEPMPARFLTGFKIQEQLDQICNQFRGMSWGVVKALDGEFLCPDTYGECPALPISPHVCLFGGRLDIQLSRTGVVEVNTFAQQNARRYYFAHDFAVCRI